MYEICDERKWILVTHSDGIDFAVILYWLQFAVFLFGEKER